MPALRGAAAMLAAALAGTPVHAADTVRIGKAVGIAWTFIGVDVGVHEGIFARYGLDVQILSFAGDAKLQQALAAGSVDFGLGSGPAMAFAVKGAPIVAVAAFANEPRNISITVGGDSPIHTVADLKGKLIAISTAGSLTEWLVKRVAATEGWGPDGLRAVAIGDAPSQTAALRSHQVDGMMGSTENGFQLAERGEGRVLVGMERYAPHFVTHVVFAGKALVASKPDLVNRFLKGFFASLAFVKANPQKTTEIAMPLQGESEAVLTKAYEVEQPMMELDGQFDPQGLGLIKRSFVEMGTLDRMPDDDQILTRHFLPVRPCTRLRQA